MRYLCEKTAIYNNIKIFCSNVKSTFYLFKILRVRKYLTRIRLIITHATLTHATFNNRKTVRLKEKRTSYGDRLASNLENYNIEKNMKSRIFASKINKKD
jgi:hypothetical protein